MNWTWSVDRRGAAKDLFGRPARVALATWALALDDSPFYLQQAQDALARVGESRTAVSQELQLMRRYGMFDSYQDGRRVYFLPIRTCSYWKAFEAIGVALQPDPEVKQERSRPS